MRGLTISAEQIAGAPPEVRRWLAQEFGPLLGALGLRDPPAAPPPPHVVGLTADEAKRLYGEVAVDHLVARVFLDLGREAGTAVTHGFRYIRIEDMLRHTRLADPRHLAACLEAINRAVRRLRGDAEATLFGYDGRGYFYIAEATHVAILAVWRELVDAQRAPAEPAAAQNGNDPGFRAATPSYTIRLPGDAA
jgi:hypothetical protein